MKLFIVIVSSTLILYPWGRPEPCDPPSFCLKIDPNSCPGSDIDNAFLDGKLYKNEIWTIVTATNHPVYLWGTIVKGHPTENGLVGYGFPIEERRKISSIRNTTGSALGGFPEKFVRGDVDNGLFAKDTRVDHTWREMFVWKHGKQPTQEELDNLTCEQVKSWFKDRYEYDGFWYDVSPENVSCYEKYPFKRFCFNASSGIGFESYQIETEIVFPDGTRCRIEKIEIDKDDFTPCSGTDKDLMGKVEPDCPNCN